MAATAFARRLGGVFAVEIGGAFGLDLATTAFAAFPGFAVDVYLALEGFASLALGIAEPTFAAVTVAVTYDGDALSLFAFATLLEVLAVAGSLAFDLWRFRITGKNKQKNKQRKTP